MSDLIHQTTSCKRHQDHPCTAISMVLEPTEKDLGGFSVRRLLPTTELRSVGPFIFFDHLGPAVFAPGKGIDVRPHPHIGLATITYVFEGEILHRDSLGEVQPIRPNELNWMTAGRGIPRRYGQRVTPCTPCNCGLPSPKTRRKPTPSSPITMPPICQRKRMRMFRSG